MLKKDIYLYKAYQMFNSKIRRILNEELLREAASLHKILHALTKNGQEKADEAEIGQLIMVADPTSVSNDRGEFVGKYWKWIYNQYKQRNIQLGDIPELRAALNTYNINKSQINKPIDSFNTLDELVREIAQYDDNFKAGRTISKGEQELEKVYEDQYVTVYIPHTWEAARKIGGDTRWCTASSSDHYFNYYLNEYGGEYYDIIRKSDGAKFQLHVESEQFMNSYDEPITFASAFNSRKEAEGLLNFLNGKGKKIGGWIPRTWFDEAQGILDAGEDPEDIFDWCDNFREGFARVELNGKYNFINTEGKLLSDMWFDECWSFINGFARIELNGKYNLINTEGKFLSDKWFGWTDNFYEGFAAVELNNKWNYINDKGKFLSDKWFDRCYCFKEGFAAVELNNKWNYINTEGKLLSDKWFDRCWSFEDGFACVELNGKRFIIDKNGKLYSKRPTNENKHNRNIVISEQQSKSIKHLLTEAASLDKIINALSKDVKDNDLNQSDLADLIMTDPTAVTNSRGQFVGKYWKWIYNQYKQGNIHLGDQPELEAALNTYNINKSQINKPIDSYKTLDELVREIAQYNDDFKAGRTISKGEQELEKVYEDEYVVVYIPHTWEAARKIGGDTQWCTASSSDNYFNYYLNQYGGEYYDIIRKLDGAKFQLHVESNQFMDREDRHINFACVFDTRKEAKGLIRFLENRGKDIVRWKPKTWFDEVEEKLANGAGPDYIFDYVGGFRDGFAMVILNSKRNFIDKKFNLLSQNRWFDHAFDFYNGVARVRVGEKYNYIKPNGVFLSPNQWFDFCEEFGDNGVANVELDGKYNWLKKNGELLSQNLWFDSTTDFVGNFATVCRENQYNFIKRDGSILFPDMWFSIIYVQENRFYRVLSIGKWNWIKTNGKLLSPDQWFDWSSNFNEGVAGIKINGKCNWIDEDGKLLFPDKWFDSVGDFYGGFCVVEQNKKRNIIDRKGRLLSTDIWFDFVGNFHEGFSRVVVDEKCNWINKSGELLFPELWFDYCENFSNGVCLADYGGVSYIVLKDGRIFNRNKEIDPKTLQESKHRTIVITENMLRKLKPLKKITFQ